MQGLVAISSIQSGWENVHDLRPTLSMYQLHTGAHGSNTDLPWMHPTLHSPTLTSTRPLSPRARPPHIPPSWCRGKGSPWGVLMLLDNTQHQAAIPYPIPIFFPANPDPASGCDLSPLPAAGQTWCISHQIMYGRGLC